MQQKDTKCRKDSNSNAYAYNDTKRKRQIVLSGLLAGRMFYACVGYIIHVTIIPFATLE